MNKEEIRTKWIRHTPLTDLDTCVDNAMQEYSDQNTKPLIDEIAELKNQVSNCNRMIGHLEEISINKQDEIAKLKASKSEANEPFEFAEWCAASEYALTDFDNRKWLHINDIEKPMKTTTELYEIFKNKNKV